LVGFEAQHISDHVGQWHTCISILRPAESLGTTLDIRYFINDFIELKRFSPSVGAELLFCSHYLRMIAEFAKRCCLRTFAWTLGLATYLHLPLSYSESRSQEAAAGSEIIPKPVSNSAKAEQAKNALPLDIVMENLVPEPMPIIDPFVSIASPNQ
jgi:hypothetical protein